MLRDRERRWKEEKYKRPSQVSKLYNCHSCFCLFFLFFCFFYFFRGFVCRQGNTHTTTTTRKMRTNERKLHRCCLDPQVIGMFSRARSGVHSWNFIFPFLFLVVGEAHWPMPKCRLIRFLSSSVTHTMPPWEFSRLLRAETCCILKWDDDKWYSN